MIAGVSITTVLLVMAVVAVLVVPVAAAIVWYRRRNSDGSGSILGEPADGGLGREWVAGLEPAMSRLRDRLDTAGTQSKSTMATFQFKATLAVLTTALATAALLFMMWNYWYGPLNTVLYAFAFAFGAIAIPSTVLLLGHALPGSGLLGTLHIVFAHIALRYPYLLDRGTHYEYAPGTKNRVWIDGQYEQIVSGHDNRSVLGWRPFGIVVDKTTVDLEGVRVDEAAGGGGTQADGGTERETVERGGYQVESPAIHDGLSTWLVDLRRVFTSGVRKIADVDILETTEEITERQQNDSDTHSPFRTSLLMLASIIVGFVFAYFAMGGI